MQFAPTGRAWAAATTEGLLIYSLDNRSALCQTRAALLGGLWVHALTYLSYYCRLLFDPFDLDIDVTRDNVTKVLEQRDFIKALVMSFRLGIFLSLISLTMKKGLYAILIFFIFRSLCFCFSVAG